jgi:hypothetical protein
LPDLLIAEPALKFEYQSGRKPLAERQFMKVFELFSLVFAQPVGLR